VDEFRDLRFEDLAIGDLISEIGDWPFAFDSMIAIGSEVREWRRERPNRKSQSQIK
jgi:hypothetical protein